MEPGRIAIVAGLGASALTVILYALSLRGSRKLLIAARFAFALTVACVVFCFGRMMWLVVNHAFQHEYVFEYSSADLGKSGGFARFFLYAATWAGQEGSFLLWVLCTVRSAPASTADGGSAGWKCRCGPCASSTIRIFPWR